MDESLESGNTDVAGAAGAAISIDINNCSKCSKCNKNFKTKSAHTKHVTQQLCYGLTEISYCRICKVGCGTNKNYVKHLMTQEHLSSIGIEQLEKIKDDNAERPSNILLADPYLSNKDKMMLGTRNLGNKYTFVFENNERQEINLIHPPITTLDKPPPVDKPIMPEIMPEIMQSVISNDKGQSAVSTACSSGTGNSGTGSSPCVDNKVGDARAPDRIIYPTERQMKLMILLSKFNTPTESANCLLKMIDNKMHIEDYYGLTTIIRENPIFTLETKQTLLTLINNFVEGLTKKRAAGIIAYKDKDIAKMVVGLSM